jgi:hypothetical protein
MLPVDDLFSVDHAGFKIFGPVGLLADVFDFLDSNMPPLEWRRDILVVDRGRAI